MRSRCFWDQPTRYDALSSDSQPTLSSEQHCTAPNYTLPAHTLISRLVLKFHEGSGIRHRSGAFKAEQADQYELSGSVSSFQTGLLSKEIKLLNQKIQTEGYQIQPLFKAKEAELTALKASGENRSGHQLADLRLYYELIPPKKLENYSSVARLLTDMNQLQSVEIAYAEPFPKLAVVSSSANPKASSSEFMPTPNFEAMQRYLDSPPFGIGASDCAWTVPGGRGSGVKIVDVEMAWNTTHEDLPALFFTYGTPVNDLASRSHETGVLGELVAVNNGFGVTGIISNAKAGYASVCSPKYGENCLPPDMKQSPRARQKASFNVADAIIHAAKAVGEGGIILIELQFPGPKTDSCETSCLKESCGYVPVEYWTAIFHAIQHATKNGVIVVEAAANGSSNLDDPIYNGYFDRKVQDSGAILVAASDTTPALPACWTNWGSRIDLHGWGSDVTTLGCTIPFPPYCKPLFDGGNHDENRFYTANFSGTSSASPIVAGAAGSAQGIARAVHGKPLEPLALRRLLVETGTPQQPSDKHIGPLPNLCRLIPLIKEDI
ncbi:MAG: S8 family peptidase [Candidatus Parabeggiatoa sp.]|nr:S8 family peptidase [Candidatus Parabeggiatoa sp.]